MAPVSSFFFLILGCIPAAQSCFCDHYPWNAWSACSQTCNHGTQHRHRQIRYDEYYWKNSCTQLCSRSQQKACNQQACPINCQLSEFGPWSECSACAHKQFRTRFVLRPSQFGGSDCSMELTQERPCHPSTECKLPDVNCKDNFKCNNGRCISSSLKCNRQNDCKDNSDERDCETFTIVCPAEKRVAPGADLVGNGFDALADEPRAAVLDNTFMGGSCTVKRPRSTLLYHRVPHNFKDFEIKVGQAEDFSIDPQQLHAQSIDVKNSRQRGDSSSGSYFLPLIFYFGSQSRQQTSSNREAFKASKTKDSKFFRVHQVLPISNFTMKDPSDLVLSLPFLQFLQALPLDYNYALYRDIFQRFGTHYYSSGNLGGHYDLLYQFNREELKTSGETEEHTEGCLKKESTLILIIYNQHSSANRCRNNRMTEKSQGSYIQSAEKSFSMVKGGRTREAEALAKERQGATPDQESFKNWAKSVLDNPAVVDYKLLPIIDLVRGISCASTKRRHLRRALRQYLEEFDTCKCAPCPNNARPVLSGTECQCVCQTGTYGTNCEIRAPDYTSEAVDGYWSCWGSWSRCDSSMKRHRTRKCDNPAPLGGGQLCDGPARQQDTCHISIFEKQETCDNDDDFTVGLKDELPPGVEGCLRPKSPANSFIRVKPQYYSFGEDEEFKCFTGFDLDGFQFFNCLPDGTWSQPKGRCVRKICLPPEIPDFVTLTHSKEEYNVGERVGLNCKEAGVFPFPQASFWCRDNLMWEPPIPADLRCTNALFSPDDLCVLNTNVGQLTSMSLCSFHAGRCHDDPLFFVSEGVCDSSDLQKLDWIQFRANMSSKSSVQEPCDLNTCYEWETCTAEKQCACRLALECPKDGTHMFCVKVGRSQRTLSLNVCRVATLKCSNSQLEIVNEGNCEAR
uniref:Complement component C6 n=1 Tax=Gouania willdenowi TaxID=441366 RepID=A0A8C5H010_GOUWI